MACGKPPNPDYITPPRPLSHPVVQPAISALRDAEAIVGRNPPGKTVDAAMKRAEWFLEYVRKSGVQGSELQRLEGRLRHLKGFAESRLRDNVGSPASPRDMGERPPTRQWVLEKFSDHAAKRNAPTVIRALQSDDHWRSKEYKEHLIRMVERNNRIPDEYKQQLPRDVADVLRVSPNAAGIVKAMTLRGQLTPLASNSKLGSNANSAIGSAYELMGTAALTRKVSTPVNEGLKLHINPSRDTVTFGDKSTINRQINGDRGSLELPTRKTIECDVRIARKTFTEYREIGVDFKHVKEGRTKYASEDLRNQVENVVKALQQGQLHEYHFVTNGSFGNSFRNLIDKTNVTLVKEGHNPISCHEFVSSIVHDPLLDSERV